MPAKPRWLLAIVGWPAGERWRPDDDGGLGASRGAGDRDGRRKGEIVLPQVIGDRRRGRGGVAGHRGLPARMARARTETFAST